MTGRLKQHAIQRTERLAQHYRANGLPPHRAQRQAELDVYGYPLTLNEAAKIAGKYHDLEIIP